MSLGPQKLMQNKNVRTVVDGTSKTDDHQCCTQFPTTYVSYFNPSNFNSNAFLGIFVLSIPSTKPKLRSNYMAFNDAKAMQHPSVG